MFLIIIIVCFYTQWGCKQLGERTQEQKGGIEAGGFSLNRRFLEARVQAGCNTNRQSEPSKQSRHQDSGKTGQNQRTMETHWIASTLGKEDPMWDRVSKHCRLRHRWIHRRVRTGNH